MAQSEPLLLGAYQELPPPKLLLVLAMLPQPAPPALVSPPPLQETEKKKLSKLDNGLLTWASFTTILLFVSVEPGKPTVVVANASTKFDFGSNKPWFVWLSLQFDFGVY
jgi:hypothetical protein